MYSQKEGVKYLLMFIGPLTAGQTILHIYAGLPKAGKIS